MAYTAIRMPPIRQGDQRSRLPSNRWPWRLASAGHSGSLASCKTDLYRFSWAASQTEVSAEDSKLFHENVYQEGPRGHPAMRLFRL